MDQDVYEELKKEYEKISVEEGEQIAHFFNSCKELILIDDCKPNSLVVFDDVLILDNNIL